MANLTDVCIRRLARFHCEPDWSWDVKGRSGWTGEQAGAVAFNYDLWTVLQGTGRMEAPSGGFDVRAGDCFILRGPDSYSVRHDPGDPLVVFAVHFDFLDRRGRVIYPDTQLYRRIQHLDFLTHLLERMEAAWLEGRDDADFWLSACLRERSHQEGESHVHGFKREQVEIVRGICTRIRRGPGMEYRVQGLAAELNCSRYHFTRVFKGITGVTPQEFVVKSRIEAAKGLLHSSSYTIGRIANLLGYKDIYFFSRQFKKKTGMSPSRYRGA